MIRKNIILLICFFIFFSCSGNDNKLNSIIKNEATDNKQESLNFNLEKGVNIGNWLSQSSDRGEVRRKKITRDDVLKLASYGFDHIRMPVDEEHLFDEMGQMDKDALLIIHNAIRWCSDAGIRVIFDMHDLRSHKCAEKDNPFWNDIKEQDKLVDMWTKILPELERYSNGLLAYEMMNEPVAPTYEEWNVISARLIALVRAKNPTRTILLGSNRWESVDEISKLNFPENDPNIILEFHFYEPFLLTHNNASWTEFAGLKLEGLKYPGLLVSDEVYNSLSSENKKMILNYRHVYTKQILLERWKQAIEFAHKKGLRLYLGEFGCLPSSGQNNRIAWTKDIVSMCKENKIAFCYWEYNRLFGFADESGFVYNSELLNALVK